MNRCKLSIVRIHHTLWCVMNSETNNITNFYYSIIFTKSFSESICTFNFFAFSNFEPASLPTIKKFSFEETPDKTYHSAFPPKSSKYNSLPLLPVIFTQSIIPEPLNVKPILYNLPNDLAYCVSSYNSSSM